MPTGIPLLELSAGYQRPQVGQLAQSFFNTFGSRKFLSIRNNVFFFHISKNELKKFVVESLHHVN